MPLISAVFSAAWEGQPVALFLAAFILSGPLMLALEITRAWRRS